MLSRLIRIILFVFVLFQTLSIFAQKEKCRFSARTGLNLAYLEYLDEDANALIKEIRRAKPGLLIGLSATVRLNPVLSVDAALVYTQKGLRYVQEPIKKGRNTMNYLEIPVSGHITSFNKHKQFWDIFIGAYAGYWTDGKYIVTDNLTGITTKTAIDFNNENFAYNRTDVGFHIGGSIYPKNKNWVFDLKYAHGFANMARKATDETEHRVITLGLKYIFARKGHL